ncbi:unnamed protein product [Euphydryas editha]|uniref:Uncharacterized protein n=1 Tax=Euphydryas editha TaxID=104508 RepID=A0AAU9UVZ0_EUPED|nr:unnamed protein product [Euphydryas editha]
MNTTPKPVDVQILTSHGGFATYLNRFGLKCKGVNLATCKILQNYQLGIEKLLEVEIDESVFYCNDTSQFNKGNTTMSGKYMTPYNSTGGFVGMVKAAGQEDKP